MRRTMQELFCGEQCHSFFCRFFNCKTTAFFPTKSTSHPVLSSLTLHFRFPPPTPINHISLQLDPLSRIQIQPKSQACATRLSHTGVAAVFAPATGPCAKLLLVRNATSPQPSWSWSRVVCVLGAGKLSRHCRRLKGFKSCCGIMSRHVNGTG